MPWLMLWLYLCYARSSELYCAPWIVGNSSLDALLIVADVFWCTACLAWVIIIGAVVLSTKYKTTWLQIYFFFFFFYSLKGAVGVAACTVV